MLGWEGVIVLKCAALNTAVQERAAASTATCLR